MQSEYSVCCYSPCGNYIAAGGTNGEIVVWDIESNKLVREESRGSHDAQCIAAINWNPTNNGELAYTDNTGQLGLVVNIIDGDSDDANDGDLMSIGGDNGVDFDDSMAVRLQVVFNFIQILLFQLNSPTIPRTWTTRTVCRWKN